MTMRDVRKHYDVYLDVFHGLGSFLALFESADARDCFLADVAVPTMWAWAGGMRAGHLLGVRELEVLLCLERRTSKVSQRTRKPQSASPYGLEQLSSGFLVKTWQVDDLDEARFLQRMDQLRA